jgi:hypothetical protein
MNSKSKGEFPMPFTEADEKQLQREALIEKLKGPMGKGNYVQRPPTDEEIAWQEAQAKRQEAAKRPTPPPPRTEIDPIEHRRQQLKMERHKESLKGPIKRQGAS